MKDEDQIQKDKEAVQKMIGAKAAMESAIRHIEQLKSTISRIESMHRDCMKAVADGAYVKTHYTGRDNAYSSNSPEFRSAHELSASIAKLAANSK